MELFERDKSTISRLVRNVFKEGELEENSVVANFATTATDGKTYHVDYYNLDVIISVGYRVKSKRGTQFRIWAIQVLKDYLLKGQIVNQRIERLEHKVGNIEEKIDFFIRTVLSPVEGIFYQGQIFDAYVFSSDLIKAVRKRIVLLDNYVEIAKIKSFILLRFATNDNHFTHLDKMVYDSVSIILASQYRPINHIIEILPVLYGRLVVLV